VGILLLGRLMVTARRFQSMCCLSVVVGLITIFAAFVPHVFLFMMSTVGIVAWLLWSGLALSAKVGQACFTKWWLPPRKRRANGARRTA